MSLEFRNAVLAPLSGISVVAPAGVIIGVIGEKGSGVTELLKLAGGRPTGERRSSRGPGATLRGPGRFVKPGAGRGHRARSGARYTGRRGTGAHSHRPRSAASRRCDGSARLARGSSWNLLCDEIWWLDGGRIAAKGDPKETLANYRRHVAERVRSWGETFRPAWRRCSVMATAAPS